MNTKSGRQSSRNNSSFGRKRTGPKNFRSKNKGFSGRRSFNSSPNNRRQNRGGRKIATFNPSQFINKNPIKLEVEVYEPKNTFDSFGIDKRIINTVKSLGIERPTPIQDQVIPEIIKGNDVIGLAETGTGKTAAFLLPLIEQVIKDNSKQILILAPTRELAIQINSELKKLSVGFKIFSTVCVGGMNIRPQIKFLSKHNHFIIGTPGRVMDLINRKVLVSSKTRVVVLDEADRMLDMGFIKSIREIISTTPEKRQTLLFSATNSPETRKLTMEFLKDPIEISVKKKDVTNSIEQDIVQHTPSNKFETLKILLQNSEFKKVLVFGSMKHSVEKLSKDLTNSGIKSESIHGNKNHSQRQRALDFFKKGFTNVLVATDVAARGIHVDNVSHVINYDLPQTFEDYVHRIGRTGRGNSKGKALTFVQNTR